MFDNIEQDENVRGRCARKHVICHCAHAAGMTTTKQKAL